MNKPMVVLASLLMLGTGVLAQDKVVPPPTRGQPGVQRPAKMVTRPNAANAQAERGAMASSQARNQIEGMSMFLEADVNKDGIIDDAEAKAAEAKFIELFYQRVKEHNAQMIRRFDKNGDGVLDEQEKTVMRETLEKFSKTLRTKVENLNEAFRRIDKDGSGLIKAEELQRFIVEQQKQALPAAFKPFDKNGDGKLEGEELTAAVAGIIKKCDRNNDGQLDLQELRLLWRDGIEHSKELRTEQNRKPQEEQWKKRFDLNGDGVLDEQEKARMTEELRKLGNKRPMAPPLPE
jgi:Ca2+-binding EF-hand superfamily protein